MHKKQWYIPQVLILTRFYSDESVLCVCKDGNTWVNREKGRANNACFVNRAPSKMINPS